jgi:hypothetical protein
MNEILDSKRWRYGVFMVLVFIAGSLILFWPELTGKNLPPMHSIGLYHYIYFSAMSYFVNTLGMLPNWWPAYNSGYPINLTLDGFLNPVFLLTLKFLPPFSANNLMIVFLFIVNGLSFYALARNLRLSRTGSLIGALSYAFSGVVIRHSVVTGIAALMPFLPLSFLCLLKIFEGRLRWFWAWLILMIYAWIGGWSEMTVYALTALGFFAIYLIFQKRNSENINLRYPLIFFGVIPLSALILSPWFLSVLHFISQSQRAGGTNLATASYMPTTFSHFLHMFNPRISVLYGDLLPFFPLGNHPNFLFFGTLPFLLTLSVFFIKNIKGNKYLPFFIGLAAGSILMTINHSPLFWLFHQLPVLKWFGGYWKWSFVIVFSLSILAGYGFDNLRDFFQHRFRNRAIIILWTFFIAAVLMLGLIAIFDSRIKSLITSYGISNYKNTPDRVFARSGDYYEDLITKIADSLIYNFSFKSGWMILMAALWFIALLYLTAGKYVDSNRRKWKALGVAIAFAGSVLPWYGIMAGPPISYLTTEPETAKFMHSENPYSSDKLPIDSHSADLVPYRIFIYVPEQFVAELSQKYGVNLTAGDTRDPLTKELMDDNAHIFFRFDTFQNHQTLTLKRLLDAKDFLMRQNISDENRFTMTTPFEKFVSDFSAEKNMRILGAFNVKYVLSSIALNGAQPVFGTKVIENKIPVYVYQNPYFMPRWYYANEILWAWGGEPEILKTLDTIKDFKKTTLLETLTLNDKALSTKSNPDDKIEIDLYTAGKLRLKTKTQNYRFLIFSESRFPDFWQATVNGEKTPIYTANYLYQAILVPPGENIVEFRYPGLMEQGAIALNKRIETLLKIK